MNKICIGSRPDYAMIRGKQIIAYYCKIILHQVGTAPTEKILRNRSLVMLCKEIFICVPGLTLNATSDWYQSDVSEDAHVMTMISHTGVTKIQLRLEQGLSKEDKVEIIDFYTKAFGKSKLRAMNAQSK